MPAAAACQRPGPRSQQEENQGEEREREGEARGPLGHFRPNEPKDPSRPAYLSKSLSRPMKPQAELALFVSRATAVMGRADRPSSPFEPGSPFAFFFFSFF